MIEDFRKDLGGIEETAQDSKAEPFNLSNEREEKLIDEGGNLLLLRDRLADTDPWLESIQDQPLAVKKEEKTESAPIDVQKLKASLRKVLRADETVSQAMNRLRGNVCVKKTFKKNVRKGSSAAEKINSPEIISEEFKELCRICSDLVAEGCDDLYEWKVQDLSESRYWKLKGPNGIVGPVDDQQIQIWKQGNKLKGFAIQRTDKTGKTMQGDTWMDFDSFELY